MENTTDLIKLLIKRGLSQAEISRQTGIPQSKLSRWGSGKVTASANDALKLAALAARRTKAHPEPTSHTEAA